MSSPRLSAVMTVRDGERYLAEALDSIVRQPEEVDEIVVVDDGSTDRTAEIAASYGPRVRLVRQEPLGHAHGFNRAIESATGDLVAFLDADDVWTDDSLAVRLERIGREDAPDGVYGAIRQFVSPELGADAAQRYRIDDRVSPVPLMQSMVVRRSVFDRVGLLDTGYKTAANIDWVSRAFEAGMRFEPVDAIVVRRRIHTSNMGVALADQKHRDLPRIVRAHRQRMEARRRREADAE